MAEDFRAYDEFKLERRNKIEPTRFEYAVDKLVQAGHRVANGGHGDKSIVINGYIKLWPYTGWWSGRGVGSGRGIHELIKKLKEKK